MPRWTGADDVLAEIRRLNIAYLEHELLDAPYQHTDLCRICFPGWRN